MMSKPSSKDEIIETFEEDGLSISDGAIHKIQENNNTPTLIDKVKEKYNEVLVVTEGHIEEVIEDKDLENEITDGSQKEEENEEEDKVDVDEVEREERGFDGYEEESEKVGEVEELDREEENEELGGIGREEKEKVDTSRGIENEFRVVDELEGAEEKIDEGVRKVEVGVSGDITGESRCTGEVEDFEKCFTDRLQKIRKILMQRPDLDPVPLRRLNSFKGKEVEVIGILLKKWSSRSGKPLATIEDTSSRYRVMLPEDRAEEVVTDEVIGLRGTVAKDGGIIWGDDIIFPDIPTTNKSKGIGVDSSVALISDLHIGSEMFAEKKWDRFVDWTKNQENLEYVVVGGDFVDGIGIYPKQDKELEIEDLYQQHVACAEKYKELPDHLKIINIMGNHDTVRLAEPQPAIPDEFREPFTDNVEFYGNPVTINFSGVDILSYHGMALNPLSEKIPDTSLEEPESLMKRQLKKRHLAPVYGDTRIAPEKEDYLVVDEVPDIFHTGHIHMKTLDEYRGVKLVNSGAFQHQTSFQKSVGIMPDVGYVSVVDLEDLSVKQFEL